MPSAAWGGKGALDPRVLITVDHGGEIKAGTEAGAKQSMLLTDSSPCGLVNLLTYTI